jgi:hypothetical protein
MTKVVAKKNVGSAIGELFKTQQKTQQGNTGGVGGGNTLNPNPDFDTIGVGGIILRPGVTAPGAAPGLTGLRLTPGSNLGDVWVDVEWSGPADESATQYHVEYAEKNLPALTYTLENVLTTSGTSMRVRPLRPNTIYGFRVSSLNRIGRFSETFPAGDGYQDITTSGDTTVPGTVTGLQASGGYQSVTATWNEAADADVKNGQGVYELQMDTASSFDSANLKSVRVGGTIASFSNLQLSTTYYLRVAAIDASGNQGIYSNIVSAQTAGEVVAKPSDGIPPASSPSPVRLRGGSGFIYVEWLEVINTDPVTYDVHLLNVSGFTPSSANKAFSTPGTFGFIKQTPGGFALAYDVTYYIKIVARDNDGSAPASPQVSTKLVKVAGEDIRDGSITTVLIADAAIGTAKIADASIIEAKIVNAAITSAKIANAAIGSAHIQDAAILNAKIANAAIDDAKIASLSATKVTFGTMNGDRITGNTMDINVIKTSSLNASTITLAGGAFRVLRSFTNVTGMLINSEGISLYNSLGVRKIFLDAQTGNGAFAGNIDSSSITSSKISSTTITGGTINGGAINGGTITGSLIRTSSFGKRVELPASDNRVRFVYLDSDYGDAEIYSSEGYQGSRILIIENSQPTSSDGEVRITLRSKSATYGTPEIDLNADRIRCTADILSIGALGIVPSFFNGEYELSVATDEGNTYAVVGAKSYRTYSSAAFKKNIRKFDGESISFIRDISPKTFNFLSKDPAAPEVDHLGFIAEDLPEEVRGGDGYYLPGMIALLWKAVQELDAKVESNGKR